MLHYLDGYVEVVLLKRDVLQAFWVEGDRFWVDKYTGVRPRGHPYEIVCGVIQHNYADEDAEAGSVQCFVRFFTFVV